jgi:hypothetical protein
MERPAYGGKDHLVGRQEVGGVVGGGGGRIFQQGCAEAGDELPPSQGDQDERALVSPSS